MGATEHLERALADLEAEQAKISTAMSQLRAAIATMRADNGGVAVRPVVGGGNGSHEAPFSKKYDVSASQLILGLLQDNRRPMHVGQVFDALRARGFQFKKQTVAFNLGKLHAEGDARRVKAPAGSGGRYAFAYVINEAAKGGDNG